MSNYRFRFYEIGDEYAIIKLFSTVYGQNISIDWWRWRYNLNPLEDIQIALAFDGNELVSHYAVSPIVMCYGQKKFKAALSMTTMTHPDHEGQGLFVTLASMLYDRLKIDGYDFVFGFPNQKSHGIFIKKLNFRDIATIPTLVLEIENTLAIKNKREFCYSSITEVNSLIESKSYKQWASEHSCQYLKWRFGRESGNDYKLLSSSNSGTNGSFIVFKEYDERSIDIVHIHGSDLNVIALIQELIAWARLNGKTKFMVWCNIHATLHTALERLGFKFSGQVTYFFCLQLTKNDTVMRLNNWELNMSLSDVY